MLARYVLVACVWVCLTTIASAVRYTITDLGVPADSPPEVAFSNAFAINESGQIVGSASGGAFLWQEGHMELIPATAGEPNKQPITATGIEESGDAVGFADGFAFLYSNGVTTRITPVVFGNGNNAGLAINDLGHAVGWSHFSDRKQGFLYDDSGLTDLSSFGFDIVSAYGINNHDQIVGTLLLPEDGGETPYLLDDGLVTPLPKLEEGFNRATDINEVGQVIGVSAPVDLTSDHARSFVYHDGDMQDIGSLGGPYTYAHALNDLGQIVGDSSLTRDAPSEAFVYENGDMLNLNDRANTCGKWNLVIANDINNAGQIVGVGYLNDTQTRGYLLTPAERFPGDVNDDGIVDLVDLNLVRNYFGGDGPGDANEDGIVDLKDLNAVRNNFGASVCGGAVPEPPSLILLAAGAISLAALRQRHR